MGEGDVRDRGGQRLGAAEALRVNGLTPVVLAEKEGLALINGTDGMLGQLILALADGEALMQLVDVAAAMVDSRHCAARPGLPRRDPRPAPARRSVG